MSAPGSEPTNSTAVSASGQATLRPRARLIGLIGDELISDERVAVVELVKNAYDADASNVHILFTGENSRSPDSLVITDDGVGMTLETVLRGWLEPGTVIKKSTLRSAGGRPYQGAKGVGRFAAARLARSLKLETKTSEEGDAVVVLIDWGRFDDASYLDQIHISYDTLQVPDLRRGTRLTLEGLRSKKAWAEDDYRALYERLSRLLSPFNEINDFRIDLTVPGQPELSGKIEPHALTQKPKYRLAGTLSSDGTFSGSMEVDGERVKSFDKHALGKKGETVDCGGFEIEVRAWDRDRLGLTPYMLEFQVGIQEIRRILTTYSGVSLFRDGFRVHPYGEPGNDWLQLDNRSRQVPTMRLANNQQITGIRLSRAGNPNLIDRTTREGLVHNQAYEALAEWTVRILSLLESERYRLRPREEPEQAASTSLFEAFDLSAVVEEVDRQLGGAHPVAKLVRQTDSEVREGVQRLQEHWSRLLMTAGIGQMVDLVIHEMGAPIGRVNRELAHLERQLGTSLDKASFESTQVVFTSIRGWLEQLTALRTLLDPKTAGKRGRATSFDVKDEVEGNLLLFENLLKHQGLTVEVSAPDKDPIVVHMSRAAVGQVVANLLDNSVYWLTRHHGDGKGGKIEIRLTRLDHGFRLEHCDDGPGVQEADRERIFDPYYSTKANGMGLGLYVARQVMERYGRLSYRDDCNLAGACFEAEFARGVGL